MIMLRYASSLAAKLARQGTTLPTGYDKDQLWGDYANYTQVNVGNRWNPVYKNQVTVDGNTYTVDMDHSGPCSNASYNDVQIIGDNLKVWEDNPDQGRLDTEITFTDDNDNNGWDVGDLFAWITFGQTNGERDGRIWLHWAFATAINVLNPNRS